MEHNVPAKYVHYRRSLSHGREALGCNSKSQELVIVQEPKDCDAVRGLKFVSRTSRPTESGNK